jgi:hypothetical protein
MRSAGVCEHARGVNRSTIIVLLALAATFAGFVFASNARLRGGSSDVTPTVAASPQAATLDWTEPYGKAGERVVFTVHSLEVTHSGWNAKVGIDNRTKVGWELAPGATPEGSFGLQLFETGDKKELDRMVEMSGGREVPVILENGKVTVGFGGT